MYDHTIFCKTGTVMTIMINNYHCLAVLKIIFTFGYFTKCEQ